MRRSHALAAAVVAAAAAVTGCGISQEQFAAKEAESAKFQKAFNDQTEMNTSLRDKVNEQNVLIVDLETKLTLARKELAQAAEAKAQAEAKASSLEARSAQYAQLAQSLQGQIQAGQVEISELRGKMTVRLKDKILFASGSASIGKDGLAALDAVAEAFKELRGKNVVVAGYTDDVPTGKAGLFKDNWDLSTARAAAVVRYLQAKGVDPAVLGVAGFSQYRPEVPNDSTENRSLNRRIEISLTAADAPPTVESPDKAAEPAR
jgi:chemotaxis protein MotB